MALTTIYKIKKGNQMTKQNYTLQGAKAIKKAYEKKGEKVEIVPYKDVKIFDNLDTGQVLYYSETE